MYLEAESSILSKTNQGRNINENTVATCLQMVARPTLTRCVYPVAPLDSKLHVLTRSALTKGNPKLCTLHYCYTHITRTAILYAIRGSRLHTGPQMTNVAEELVCTKKPQNGKDSVAEHNAHIEADNRVRPSA